MIGLHLVRCSKCEKQSVETVSKRLPWSLACEHYIDRTPRVAPSEAPSIDDYGAGSKVKNAPTVETPSISMNGRENLYTPIHSLMSKVTYFDTSSSEIQLHTSYV